MRVLVGCEESGYLRSEFRRHGHGAWSCDLLPAADGSGYHLQCDIHYALAKSWDLIILHPPCTALCVAGNKHYAGSRERDAALTWTRQLWELARKAAPRVCLEQPVSVLTLPDASRQTVQPWMFRIAESKATVLHTFGLPPLWPWVTEKPAVLHEVVWKMPPSADRSRKRGHLAWLARPMAEQWGQL
jgi:hypothetical protein